MEETRLSLKELADEFSINPSKVNSILRDKSIVGERDPEKNTMTFSYYDFQDALAEHDKKSEATSIEYAAELFKRILPELKETIAEVVKKEITLGIAIRDSKEARLVEVLSSVSQLVTENRGTLHFLIKTASQINNAGLLSMTSGGETSAFPTVGVSGARSSFGVETSVSKNPKKYMSDESHAMQNFGNHSQTNSVMSRTVAMAASSAQQEKHKGKSKEINKSEFQFAHEISPVFEQMVSINPDMPSNGLKVLNDYSDFIDSFLNMSNEERKTLDTHDLNKIEEILQPWEEISSDAPVFKTFYTALTNIRSWVDAKKEKLPPIIMFLSLNRNCPGFVSPMDFMLALGLDE